jgi:hypothetical protein
MSQEESTSTRPSRPRSRAANRDHQPTVAQLARLGIKVRDFIHESTLPPVRTVYRQPRQIQPSLPRQLHREDTEPLDGQSQDRRTVIGRTATEPMLEKEAGPSITRELGGFFVVDGSTDRIVNSGAFSFHPQSTEYPQVIQPLIVSQETGMIVPTPTVTPNGSLQWKESPTLPERNHTPPMMLSHLTRSLHHSLSGFSSPLTPLPPSPSSRQGSSVLSNRSLSMGSIQKPYPKRRKISIDNTNSRPGLKRYYLRKRSVKHVSPSKRFHPGPASSLSRTVSVRSDHLHRTHGAESSSPSSRPLYKNGSECRRS